MRMRSIASRALPGLIICTCFAASAAEAPGKTAIKELRLTPFVLGAASSKAKLHASPKNEQQALATKRVTRAGVIEMELPEDRAMNLVAVRRADGTTEIREELAGDAAPAAAQQEAHE